jgi:glycosyltransferase involved in cell wall biosynthesis
MTATIEQEPKLSVIVPTIGRPTLSRTLASIEAQRTIPGDQTIVIRDDLPHRDWGAWARAEGITQAAGDFLLFMDDDDAYVPAAFDVIRAAVTANPDVVHIFRMRRFAPFNDVLWHRKNLSAPGQVGTPMFAVPNRREWLGTWSRHYEGDFEFLRSTLAKMCSEPIWHEDVIAEVYPALDR